MKKLLLTLSILAAVTSVQAQGTIALKNVGSGYNLDTSANQSINARIYSDSAMTVAALGAGFSAQLYLGAAPIGDPVQFNTGIFAGYFASTPTLVVPGVAANANATFTVRAWEGGVGTTFENSLLRGESNPFTVRLGDASQPNQTPTLFGLQSFGMTVVPEPSVVALAILGAGALLLRRKKA